MTRTILITGAGGFLARHTAAEFRAGGWRTLGLGRTDPDHVAALYDAFQLDDLADPSRVASLLDKFKPAAVVHLAAPSSVPESLRRPLPDLEAHVVTTARLFEAIRLSAIRTRVLLVSSAAVYGDPERFPVAEDARLRPVSPYGFHKLHQELICDESLAIFGIPAAKARVFSTFGPGLRRLAVWDLTKRMLAGDMTVLGTGEEVRDYLYVADVASAFRAIVENGAFDGGAINVASGEGTTIAELARRIHARVGGDIPLHFTGNTQSGMPAAWVADVTQLRGLGWAPRFTLDEGLGRTFEWIQRNV